MIEENLLEAVIQSIPLKEIHPLHMAMLEECCEKVIEAADESMKENSQQLINCVNATFLTSNGVLKSTLKAALDAAGTDDVNLNYRGEEFVINRESGLLKDE
ncbi:MAG: hypothetical protein ACJA1C_000791 [Crocinitomicaceae bacterium]|jgi:hypothetical protein